MTAAILGAAGAIAVPNASWLKFVTLGNNGSEYGYSSAGGPAGSIAYTDRVGGQVATRFMYNYSIPLPGEFNFQIDESNPSGFNFTRLLVEDFTGTLITLLKSDAIEYSGFPIKGWIWNSIPGGGPLWTLGSVGSTRKIFIQR